MIPRPGVRSIVRAAVLSIACVFAAASPADAKRVFGVTGEVVPRVISFDSGAPGTLISATAITGLASGETIVGLDQRTADGQLYALTVTGADNTLRLRALQPSTGALTAGVVVTNGGEPYTALPTGDGVGVDFNPVSDRLRVTTGSGQNLRIHPDNGAVAAIDGNISAAAGYPVATPQIVANGYTNAVAGATVTTLYDIDVANSYLAIQNPPNGGVVNAVGALGVTGLTPAATDFDIAPGDTVSGLLTTRTGLASSLSTVDLASGAATLVGAIGTNLDVREIAATENEIGLAQASRLQGENASSADVTITRADPRGSVSVDYATADGTAKAGEDYVATSGSVSFAPGEVARTVAVTLLDDGRAEPTEGFDLTLSHAVPSAGAGALLLDTTAHVLIADDDSAAVVPPAIQAISGLTPPTRLALLAAADGRTRAKLRSGGLPVRFSCNEACSVVATVKKGTKTIGSGKGVLRTAGVGRLTAKLTKTGRARLGKATRVTVAVAGTTTARHTARTTVTVPLR